MNAPRSRAASPTARAALAGPPPPRRRGSRAGWLLLLAGAPVGLLVALVHGHRRCWPAPSRSNAPTTGAPADDGARPAVAGRRRRHRPHAARRSTAVREGSPYASQRAEPGEYVSTSYGPPWGGIQGQGIATSGGLRIDGGRPRWYMVAVDPVLVGHGQLIYLWPNPFDWTRPVPGRRHRRRDHPAPDRLLRLARPHPRNSPGAGAPPPSPSPPAAPAPPASSPPASADPAACPAPPADGGAGETLALPGVRGDVTVAALANAPGRPVRPELLRFLEGVAGIAGRAIVLDHRHQPLAAHQLRAASAITCSAWPATSARSPTASRSAAASAPASPPPPCAPPGLPEREAFRLAARGRRPQRLPPRVAGAGHLAHRRSLRPRPHRPQPRLRLHRRADLPDLMRAPDIGPGSTRSPRSLAALTVSRRDRRRAVR